MPSCKGYDIVAEKLLVAKPCIQQYKSLFQQGAESFVEKGLHTVAWNHGKVLAVNGPWMMTGGGIYNILGRLSC